MDLVKTSVFAASQTCFEARGCTQVTKHSKELEALKEKLQTQEEKAGSSHHDRFKELIYPPLPLVR